VISGCRKVAYWSEAVKELACVADTFPQSAYADCRSHCSRNGSLYRESSKISVKISLTLSKQLLKFSSQLSFAITWMRRTTSVSFSVVSP
jgi:hypothetical protein